MKRWTTSALLLIRLDREHGKSSSLPSLFWSKDMQNPNLSIQIQIENLEENEPGDPGSARFPFHSKTKSTSSKYLLYIFGVRLSFKGEDLCPVCASMQWTWKLATLYSLGRKGWGIIEKSEGVLWYFLLLKIDMEILSWTYEERAWEALLHLCIAHLFTHTYICLMSTLSLPWVSPHFNICGTRYSPKMATIISPTSQGSFRILAFLHHEIGSMSPPLQSGIAILFFFNLKNNSYSFDYLNHSTSRVWQNWHYDFRGYIIKMSCTFILFSWDTISWKLKSKVQSSL